MRSERSQTPTEVATICLLVWAREGQQWHRVPNRPDAGGHVPEPGPDEEAEVGGDRVCWLDEVCDACGGLDDGPPRTVCSRCGAPRSGDGRGADR